MVGLPVSGEVHLITIHPDFILDTSKFDTTKLPSYDELVANTQSKKDSSNEELDNLNSEVNSLSQKQINAKNAAQAVQDATTQLNAANGKYNAANQALKNSKYRVNEIQNDLINTQSQQKSAEDKLSSLTASNKEKLENLNAVLSNQKQAEQAVQDAQTQLNNANDKLKAAQADQENLNKDIANKEAAIQKSNNELKDLIAKRDVLINAPQSLATAKAELEKANSDLKAAQDTLKADKNAFTKLASAKDSADDAVANAQAELDQAQTNLRNAKDKLANAEKELNNIKEAEMLINDNSSTQSNTNKQQDKTKKAPNTKKSITKKSAKKYAVKTVKLTHNAFVYDRNGKRVRLTWVGRGKNIKASKIVTIKGIRYYQIGKNQFIKVANTKIKTHAVKLHGYVKAKLNHKVATVDRHGRKNGNYLLGRRTYKFNEKRTINGKVYYKVAGKNDWIVASKLRIIK